jgi:hypothetical protein
MLDRRPRPFLSLQWSSLNAYLEATMAARPIRGIFIVFRRSAAVKFCLATRVDFLL